MQYINLSVAQNGYRRWKSLSELQRLTIAWTIVTVFVGLVYWIAQLVIPENPIVFRYFICLYAIDSLIFFLIGREYRALAQTLLVFLVALEVVVLLYYLFSHLSFGV